MSLPDASREERLAEFFRRLGSAPAASNQYEAIHQISDILNQVEDDLTSIRYDPTFPLDDGRMYPPQPDNKRSVPGHPDVTRYRSKGHSTLIGDNGSIQIVGGRSRDGRVLEAGD